MLPELKFFGQSFFSKKIVGGVGVKPLTFMLFYYLLHRGRDSVPPNPAKFFNYHLITDMDCRYALSLAHLRIR